MTACRTQRLGALGSGFGTPVAERPTTPTPLCQEPRIRIQDLEREIVSKVINQWLPAAHCGDAVDDGACPVRNLLRARGHDSDIYALTLDDDLRGKSRAFSGPAARQGDVTILHFATASPMSEALVSLAPGRQEIDRLPTGPTSRLGHDGVVGRTASNS